MSPMLQSVPKNSDKSEGRDTKRKQSVVPAVFFTSFSSIFFCLSHPLAPHLSPILTLLLPHIMCRGMGGFQTGVLLSQQPACRFNLLLPAALAL